MKRGQKSHKFEREMRLARVAELRKECRYQWEIAKDVGVSQQQVSCDFKTLDKRLAEKQEGDTLEHRNAKVAEYEHLKRTYWEAWKKSLDEKTSKTAKKKSGGKDGKSEEQSIKAEERDGNSAFLAGVERCAEAQAKLLGLMIEKREITGSLTLLDAIKQSMENDDARS